MSSSNPTEKELENFRRQWREEVSARNKQQTTATASGQTSSSGVAPSRAGTQAVQPPASSQSNHHVHDELEPRTYHDLVEKEMGRKLDDPTHGTSSSKEPVSALDHYEKAVERETQGSLGDSVRLYRKAFKMDDRVHEQYKKKYFSSQWNPPSTHQSEGSEGSKQSSSKATGSSSQGLPPSVYEMILEFSQLSIPVEPPPTDLSPPLKCLLKEIPEELLEQIFLRTALVDLSALSRLAQVCKRFAYLVMTEERIWKRVAEGNEIGFAAMHYHFTCSVDGSPLVEDPNLIPEDDPINYSSLTVQPRLVRPLALTRAYPTYLSNVRSRPRIRYNGCYISTVNYTRPGLSNTNQLTWSSPVLIVTYYRYFRFFRDGTAISLLTTAEPQDVVHHLTKENLHAHHGNTLPSSVMKDALRGRWRLSGNPFVLPPAAMISDPDLESLDTLQQERADGEKIHNQDTEPTEEEGDVHIETLAPVPKYMYKIQFGLGNAGRTARNNKLAWKGYWSYNRLTDDWAEFQMKNYKPFYFSRVKSYGMGWE
ncbi:hypothetical protein K402DRAFT_453000 [Aulographum hederae CBS 113979]|uniref:F-box domain-containing protein n=1 Tax=Aulographum hederae CBS 113979 TaxID=1176131 RepID=A0A6G1H5G0_9PEZI|nr:hypothetical protein K402DRAFT_453000 [Aulographum hederae CBS 113979]